MKPRRPTQPRKKPIAAKPVVSLAQFDFATLQEAKKVLQGTSDQFRFDVSGELINLAPPDESHVRHMDDEGKAIFANFDKPDNSKEIIELPPQQQAIIFAVTAMLIN